MRRLAERLEEDEPAFAVGTRAAGQGHGKDKIERRNFPPLLGAAGLHRDSMRLQQVLRRSVLAVLVVDTLEDGELAARSQMYLELADAVDDMVVHTFGVAPIHVAARLPVALENSVAADA